MRHAPIACTLILAFTLLGCDRAGSTTRPTSARVEEASTTHDAEASPEPEADTPRAVMQLPPEEVGWREVELQGRTLKLGPWRKGHDFSMLKVLPEGEAEPAFMSLPRQPWRPRMDVFVFRDRVVVEQSAYALPSGAREASITPNEVKVDGERVEGAPVDPTSLAAYYPRWDEADYIAFEGRTLEFRDGTGSHGETTYGSKSALQTKTRTLMFSPDGVMLVRDDDGAEDAPFTDYGEVASGAHVAFTRRRVFVDGALRAPRGVLRDAEGPWEAIARELERRASDSN